MLQNFFGSTSRRIVPVLPAAVLNFLIVCAFDYVGPDPILEGEGLSVASPAGVLPATDALSALMCKTRAISVTGWIDDDFPATQVEPCVPVFDVGLQAYKYRLLRRLHDARRSTTVSERFGKLERAVQRFRLTCMLAAQTKPVADPLSYAEVMNSVNAPAWRQAMQDELAVMAKFKVYKLVQRPPGANVVSCRCAKTAT